VQVNGAKHLIEARSLGRGVLLVAGHFTALDIFSQAIAAIADTDVMYRENKNAAWEWLQLQGRKHYFKAVIERSDIRETLRRLKAGDIVWYAPDQDYGAKHSVFAPFFGIQAASITATPRIARFNNSPVVFMTHYRNESNIGWTMTFYPMLEDFPSGNDVSDATRINALVEDAVRRHPAQYLWMHRRFKTRPPGEARFY
jgi:KDO2-lipid IV(A) lauroyltransferase